MVAELPFSRTVWTVKDLARRSVCNVVRSHNQMCSHAFDALRLDSLEIMESSS